MTTHELCEKNHDKSVALRGGIDQLSLAVESFHCLPTSRVPSFASPTQSLLDLKHLCSVLTRRIARVVVRLLGHGLRATSPRK